MNYIDFEAFMVTLDSDGFVCCPRLHKQGDGVKTYILKFS